MSALELVAGFLAGTLASMGMGGGTVLLLYLRLFTNTDQLKAQGMNLLFFLPSAAVAVIRYVKARLIRVKIVVPLVILGSLGAVAGGFLTKIIETSYISKLFSLLLIAIGTKNIISGLFRRK